MTPNAPPRRSSSPPGPHVILIVEDQPAHAALLRELLVDLPSESFAILEAQSLAAAEARLRASRVDAILLDLNLGDSRGLSTLLRVKPLSRGAPIIVVSGILTPVLREQALSAGADMAC